MVGNIGKLTHPPPGHLGQSRPLAGNVGGKDDIESTHTIGGHNEENRRCPLIFFFWNIHVADLARIRERPSGDVGHDATRAAMSERKWLPSRVILLIAS